MYCGHPYNTISALPLKVKASRDYVWSGYCHPSCVAVNYYLLTLTLSNIIMKNIVGTNTYINKESMQEIKRS